MNKIYVTASNLLTLSTQYLVNKSLLINLDMFAEKVHATEVSDVQFKNSKDMKGLKKFMISACTATNKKSTASAKKNLEAFDSSDKEDDHNTSSASNHPRLLNVINLLQVRNLTIRQVLTRVTNVQIPQLSNLQIPTMTRTLRKTNQLLLVTLILPPKKAATKLTHLQRRLSMFLNEKKQKRRLLSDSSNESPKDTPNEIKDTTAVIPHSPPKKGKK